MSNSICLIYNYAQHYRAKIFLLLEKELNVHFVFGDKYRDVKKMDYSLFKKNIKEIQNKSILGGLFVFQTGVINLLFKHKTFILLGDLRYLSTWMMLLFAIPLRKKVFLWSHGFYGRETRIKASFKKLFFKLAAGTFLYGNYAKSLMIAKGISHKKLFVIHNSLDYEKQLLYRKSAKQTDIYLKRFCNNNKNIIFIGRLTSEKKLDLLLLSLEKLKKEGENVNLTIIGDGEVVDLLKKIVCKRKLSDNVWFFGACYSEKILSELIYNADLCVSPGNVGLTAIHSLMFGTPVVTHNSFPYQGPEFEAIHEGKTGSFFIQTSVDSLVQEIRYWTSTNIQREIIRKECYKVIDDKWNPNYQLKVFKKVLSQH